MSEARPEIVEEVVRRLRTVLGRDDEPTARWLVNYVTARSAAPSPREGAVEAVVDWLRGDQAERVRADAIRDDVPPEDALAHVIEHWFLSAARPSSPTPEETP